MGGNSQLAPVLAVKFDILAILSLFNPADMTYLAQGFAAKRLAALSMDNPDGEE